MSAGSINVTKVEVTDETTDLKTILTGLELTEDRGYQIVNETSGAITITDDVSGLLKSANIELIGNFEGSLVGTDDLISESAANDFLTFSGNNTNVQLQNFTPIGTRIEESEAMSVFVTNGAKINVAEDAILSNAVKVFSLSDSLFNAGNFTQEGGSVNLTGTSTEFTVQETLSVIGAASMFTAADIDKLTATTIELSDGATMNLNGVGVLTSDEVFVVDSKLTVSNTIMGTNSVLLDGSGTLRLEDSQLTIDELMVCQGADTPVIQVVGDSTLTIGTCTKVIGEDLDDAEEMGDEEDLLFLAAAAEDEQDIGEETESVFQFEFVVTEDTIKNESMLVINDGAITDNDEITVTISSDDVNITDWYLISEQSTENKKITYVLSDELDAAGRGILRTPSGVYLTERKYDMADYIAYVVNPEWAENPPTGEITRTIKVKKSDGSWETTTYTYTYGVTAFSKLSEALASKAEQKKDVYILSENNTPEDLTFSIGGSESGDGWSLYFNDNSKINALNVTATGNSIVTLTWDSTLAYTGTVTGAKSRLVVDFMTFDESALDKNTVYFIIDGTMSSSDLTSFGSIGLNGEPGNDWTYVSNSSDHKSVYYYHKDLGKYEVALSDSVATYSDAQRYSVGTGVTYYNNLNLFAITEDTLASKIAEIASSENRELKTLVVKNEKEGNFTYNDLQTYEKIISNLISTEVLKFGITIKAYSDMTVGNKASTEVVDTKIGADQTITGLYSFDGNSIIGANSTLANNTITVYMDEDGNLPFETSAISNIGTLTVEKYTSTQTSRLTLGDVTGGSNDEVFTVNADIVTAEDVTGNICVNGDLTLNTYTGNILQADLLKTVSGTITVNNQLTLSESTEIKDLIFGDGVSTSTGYLTTKGSLKVTNLNFKVSTKINEGGIVTVDATKSTLSISSGKTLNITLEQARELKKISTDNMSIKGAIINIYSGELTDADKEEYIRVFKEVGGAAKVTFDGATLSGKESITENDQSLFTESAMSNDTWYAGTTGDNKLSVKAGYTLYMVNKNAKASYNMLCGKNTVDVGAGSTLTVGAVWYASTIKLGKEASMKMEDELITSSGSVSFSAGDSVTFKSAAILKAEELGGSNSIKFGKAATVTIGKSDGEPTDIVIDGLTNLTVGNESTVTIYGSIVGRNSADTISFGNNYYGVIKVTGTIDLKGGKDTIKVGSDTSFEFGSVKGIASFSSSNSTGNTTSTIKGDYVAADMANTLSIGKNNSLTVAGIIDNGGIRSGTGTTVSIGTGAELYVKNTDTEVTAFDGIVKLTLTAGTDSMQTGFTAKGSITGTDAADTISIGNFSAVTVNGAVNMYGGSNSMTIGGRDTEVSISDDSNNKVTGDLKNIQKLTISDGGVYSASGSQVLGQGKLTISGSYISAPGSCTVSVGKYGTMTVNSNMALSSLKGTYSITVNSGATLKVGGNIDGVTKLDVKASTTYSLNGSKTDAITTFSASAIYGSTGKDSISFGNSSTATLSLLDLGNGDDTVTIGSTADVTIQSGIDLGSGTNKISVGADTTLTLGSSINDVSTFTISSGKSANTHVSVDGNIAFRGLGTFEIGGYTIFSAATITGVNKLTIKSSSSTNMGSVTFADYYGTSHTEYADKADTIDFGSCNVVEMGSVELNVGSTKAVSAMTVGKSSRAFMDKVTGVEKITVTAGTADMESELTIRDEISSDLSQASVGKNSILSLSTEGIEKFRNLLNKTDAQLEKDNIMFFDLGECEVSRNFTDEDTEKADNAVTATHVVTDQEGGWLCNGGEESNVLAYYKDTVDYLMFDSTGTWKIQEQTKGSLQVQLFKAVESSWTLVENGVTYDGTTGLWTTIDITDKANYKISVSIDDSFTAKTPIGYTLQLA